MDNSVAFAKGSTCHPYGRHEVQDEGIYPAMFPTSGGDVLTHPRICCRVSVRQKSMKFSATAAFATLTDHVVVVVVAPVRREGFC